MKAKRKEDRSLCAELMEINWRDEQAVEQSAYVTLEDISSRGLCFGSEVAIAPETKMTVSFPEGKYEGKVCYCKSDPAGFMVGIEFDPGYRWSRKEFRPSHLIQFRLRPVRKN